METLTLVNWLSGWIFLDLIKLGAIIYCPFKYKKDQVFLFELALLQGDISR
jgi:hypothetical protein